MNTIFLLELGLAFVLEIIVVSLVFYRRSQGRFVLFTLYIALSLPATLSRLLTINDYHLYFIVYWSTNALLLLLGLAAVHEIFRKIYSGFYEFRWFRLAYYGAIIFILFVAAKNAIVNPPVQSHPVIAVIVTVGITINLLQAGIAALFGVLTKPFGISHRRYAFGIMAGFAVSSLVPFAGYFARSVFGTKLDPVTQNVPAVAYILGLLIWLAAFIKPEADEASSPPMSPDNMLAIVHSYLGALRGKRKEC